MVIFWSMLPPSTPASRVFWHSFQPELVSTYNPPLNLNGRGGLQSTHTPRNANNSDHTRVSFSRKSSYASTWRWCCGTRANASSMIAKAYACSSLATDSPRKQWCLRTLARVGVGSLLMIIAFAVGSLIMSVDMLANQRGGCGRYWHKSTASRVTILFSHSPPHGSEICCIWTVGIGESQGGWSPFHVLVGFNAFATPLLTKRVPDDSGPNT